MSVNDNKKYLAFISYRHADNKELGRQWATWLHQAIETYEVPSDLVGTENGRGEVIPARIYPLFRDEEELPADADLGGSITRALDETRLLIVLCSPRAVESTYVADEIHYFKTLGYSDRIIAAMIDGEPNTSWDKGKLAHGFKVEDECFPIPLQFEYDSNGCRTDKHAEPIAADFRINNDGVPEQGWTSIEAYRLHLKKSSKLGNKVIQEKVDEYQKQQHLMLLKIIAGVIGVPLGKLTQRDQAYQLAMEQEKARKLRRWLVSVAMLAIVAIGAGIFAWFQRGLAVKNEAIAVQRLQEKMIADSKKLTSDAIELLERGETEKALRKIFEALPPDVNKPAWPINSNTSSALNRAVNQLGGASVFKGPTGKVNKLVLIGNDSILAMTEKGGAYLYALNGQLLHEWHFDELMERHVTQDGSRLIVSAYLNRKEEAKDELESPKYADYFVSKTFDIKTGKLLFDIDKKMQTGQYQTIPNYDQLNPHFSESGQLYLAQSYTYDGETHRKATLTNTETGDIVKQIDIDQWIGSGMILADGSIIVEGETYKSEGIDFYQTLRYVRPEEKAFRILAEFERSPSCKDGRVTNKLDGGSLTKGSLHYGVTKDSDYLVARIKDSVDTYNGWCLLTWQLSKDVSYSIGAFKNNMQLELESGKSQLAKLAYQTYPLLVYRDKKGRPRATKNRESAYVWTESGFHKSARILRDTIALSHYIDEEFKAGGGFVNSILMDEAGDTVWFSSVDGSIRSRKLHNGIQFFDSKLETIDTLLAEADVVVAIDNGYSQDEDRNTIEFSTFTNAGKILNAAHSLVVSRELQLNTSLYSSEIFGVFENSRQSNQSPSKLHLFDNQSGQEILSVDYSASNYWESPVKNSTHFAYLQDGKVTLYNLEDHQVRTLNVPADLILGEFKFVGENLYISASNKTEKWQERIYKIFSIEMSPGSTLQLVTEKQAQGLVMNSMSDQLNLLLIWDIAYNKPKEFSAIANNGAVSKIIVSWEDLYNQHFIIPATGKRIYVLQGGKKITEFDYDGALLSETLATQEWDSARMGTSESFIIDNDSFVTLSGKPSCNKFPSENYTNAYATDHQERYLLVKSYDAIQVYDLSNCTVIYDMLSTGSGTGLDTLLIMDDGYVWMVIDTWIAKIRVENEFFYNHRIANSFLHSKDQKQ